MGNFAARGSQFIYTDSGQEKIILDLNDFMINKSRIPFHSVKGDRTVMDILASLMDDHGGVSRETGEGNYLAEYTLLDTLILQHAVRTSKPVKAVELGCGNGVLSYHLGTILGILNKESELNCVYNTIGNGSENIWIDAISQINEEEQPNIRFLASDYDNTMLEGMAFDIVIINASNSIDNLRGTIEEAKRLAKIGGMIICMSHRNDWLLFDLFSYIMHECEDFFVNKKGFIIKSNRQNL